MRSVVRSESRTTTGLWLALVPAAIFAGWAATVAAASPILIALMACGILLAVFAAASIRQPLLFVIVFLVVIIVLPPFFFTRFGETPIYASYFLAPLGLTIIVARFPDFHFQFDPVAVGLALFLIATGLSLPFAYWLSGVAVGNASSFRWLLLAQTAMLYLLVRGGAPKHEGTSERWFLPILLLVATLSALYGIVDFYRPIPLPHPSADQFIWLGSGILRRAQGVIYEASSFANLCGFFLLIAAAAFLTCQERVIGLRRLWVLLLIPILSLAVFVSFSRSAWGSIAVGMLAFAVVSEKARLRRCVILLLALAIPLCALWYYTPELWSYLVNARLGNLAQIFTDPSLASSGRSDTWTRVLAIIEDHPQYLLFGVGYKTLPYTHLFHEEIITDNGYLSLLLESGVVGLGGWLFLSGAILRMFHRLARRSEGALRFWSTLLFSFWWGELVQMLATDAHTYWRNMILFVALMAFTLNRAEREGFLFGPYAPAPAQGQP
ncbi:MAG: O-antigen ligase family protein [Terriglobia bacterium]